MKKGQILEGIVQRIDFPNKGIVETEEGICIVKNVLPGQRVRCSVSKVRNGRAEGRLLQIVETSPSECGSPCPHFGYCGGCTYLSLPYEEQLAIKEAQVKKLLESVLGKQGTWQLEGIKASPVRFGYRNKMEFSFGDEIKDGPLALGMHKRGSFYDIVSVTECQIIDEDYRRILCCVKEYFAGLQDQGVEIRYYHRLRHIGYLRHLLVRKAAKTGEILIGLVTTAQAPDGCGEILEGFCRKLLGLDLEGKIAGILHITNDAVADVVQSDETRILYGKDFFYEELLELRFKVSVFSFFQTNSYGAEVLYRTAREYIGNYIGSAADGEHSQEKIVYDLYSGTGTIAQLMAPVAKKVIGVEIVEEAVEAAGRNAEMNGLHNCEFIAGDVLKVLDGIEEKPDVIILDPPRDGIHPKALDKIIRYGVEHILYISCKPTSLVRDLEVFLARGYEVKRAVAVDQFPWTANVETVVLLSQLKPDNTIEIAPDLDELDATAAETKAIYEGIRAYVWEKCHMKVSNLYISQVKRKYGLEVGQSYNLSKSENPKVPKCPSEKEVAIMDALKYFQMI